MQPREVEHAIEAAAGLARRDREPQPAAAQVEQHLPDAIVERHVRFSGDEVVAPALGEAPASLLVQVRRHVCASVGEAKAHHESRIVLGRGDDPDVLAGSLEGPRDHPSRIHERAVPVEDDQFVLGHETRGARSFIRESFPRRSG